MHMYVIFMIALQNYEKNVHVHNYRFFERDCVLIILFWVGQYDHQP